MKPFVGDARAHEASNWEAVKDTVAKLETRVLCLQDVLGSMHLYWRNMELNQLDGLINPETLLNKLKILEQHVSACQNLALAVQRSTGITVSNISATMTSIAQNRVPYPVKLTYPSTKDLPVGLEGHNTYPPCTEAIPLQRICAKLQ